MLSNEKFRFSRKDYLHPFGQFGDAFELDVPTIASQTVAAGGNLRVTMFWHTRDWSLHSSGQETPARQSQQQRLSHDWNAHRKRKLMTSLWQLSD